MYPFIEVECPGCETHLRVPSSAAGRRGTCPRCHAMVEVPRPTPPSPEGGDAAPRCTSARLQALFEELAVLLGKKVRERSVVDRKLLVFDLVTDEGADRTQVVTVSETRDRAGEPALLLHSTVGTIFRHDHAIEALKSAESDASMSVSLDDQSTLSVRALMNDSPPVEAAKLKPLLMRLAKLADVMEEKIFHWDRT